MLEVHAHANDRLVAALTDARLFGSENSIPELWHDERDSILLVPSPSLVLVDVPPLPSQRLATGQRETIRTKTTDSLNRYIAEQLSVIPRVERVYSKYDGRVFYTWIVIEDRDPALQRQIYAIEAKIVNRFAEFGFDFYIIYRAGKDIECQISGDLELVFKRV